MERSARQEITLKILRTVLVQISGIWACFGFLFHHWERPWASTIAFVVSCICAALALLGRNRDGDSAPSLAQRALTASALGLLGLALLSGQESSPFVWLLAALPAYAFCFLKLRPALLWILYSGGIVVLVHISPNLFVLSKEFSPGSWEVAAYQLLLIGLIALVSGAVKSLSVAHFRSLQKANQDLESSMSARAEFLSHVSHEMRHPLSTIVGALELLDPEALPQEQQDLVALAQKDAARLTGLVDSTLLLNDLNQGFHQPQPEHFTSSQLLTSLVTDYRSRFIQEGKILEEQACPCLSLYGERDSLLYLGSVFLENALKFTSQGDLTRLRVSFHENQLELSVRDTGPGISQSELEKVTELFRRPGSLSQRTERGFGLGLALADNMVNAMDGTWGVESAPGQGSRFWVRVPCMLSDKSGPQGNEEPKESLSILVVDDDPVCRKVTSRLLKKLGHQCQLCKDADDVLKLEDDSSLDLIFMDCNMPKMKGCELTELLRENGWTVPIIALTANASVEDRRRYKECGMNSVLSKPATAQKLAQAITSISIHRLE